MRWKRKSEANAALFNCLALGILSTVCTTRNFYLVIKPFQFNMDLYMQTTPSVRRFAISM